MREELLGSGQSVCEDRARIARGDYEDFERGMLALTNEVEPVKLDPPFNSTSTSDAIALGAIIESR